MLWILYSILIFLGTALIVLAFVLLIRKRLKESNNNKEYDVIEDNKTLTN